MTDRFLINKMVIYDRLTTLRTLADSFASGSFEEFDRRLCESLSRQIDVAIKEFTAEVQKREGR